MTDGLLEVGRITKAHGLRGEVVVQLHSDLDARVAKGATFSTDAGELVVISSRVHQDRRLVYFEGVVDRSGAEALRGTALMGEPIEVEGVIFVHELIGAEVRLADGTVISKDDCPRPGTTLEGLNGLKSAFREGGGVTAGNACPLNDGAAAVVIMSDTKAKELGITPLARIVSSGVSGLNPEIMGLGPIDACRQAMARANLTISDIDLVEINEAFAAQVIPSAKHLGISWDKLNVRGGAIALGHPFGQTGARIMTTLLNALEDEGKTFGMESMCVGGGQGMAMIVERLS
jgi:hypothetical protein